MPQIAQMHQRQALGLHLEDDVFSPLFALFLVMIAREPFNPDIIHLKHPGRADQLIALFDMFQGIMVVMVMAHQNNIRLCL